MEIYGKRGPREFPGLSSDMGGGPPRGDCLETSGGSGGLFTFAAGSFNILGISRLGGWDGRKYARQSDPVEGWTVGVAAFIGMRHTWTADESQKRRSVSEDAAGAVRMRRC